MSEFKLGNIFLKDPLILAPMAGVTDKVYRTICRQMGADMLVSEMISAKGMHYNDLKTAVLAEINKDSTPSAVQIFGSDPEIMAEAAVKLEKGDYKGFSGELPVAIDINVGCPVNKIVSNKEGSALMKNPRLVGDIVKEVSEATSLPVTVKIRAGWDENSVNAVEIAEIAEKNGAKMITVHGRTRSEMYEPPVRHSVIADVKRAVSVPVIANGGVFTPEDAVRMYELTGCDGIMIGRGAEGNPFIFKMIKDAVMGNPVVPPTPREKVNMALYHVGKMVEDKGEYMAIREARKHVAWYLKGIRNSAALRGEVNYVESYAELEEKLMSFINEVELQET